MDPSPFREKDLDPEAEEFIVGWARELPRDRPLRIVIHLTEPLKSAVPVDQAQLDVEESIQNFFSNKAEHERRQFSELMRIGRMSLIVGLMFLATCFAISNLLAAGDDAGPVRSVLRESLIIVGWVALWRPLEIFLYDWWPIHRHIRLYRRLSAAKVALIGPAAAQPDQVRR